MRRLVFVAAVLAACSAAGEAKPGIEPSHRGVYLGGNQLNSFVACGDKKMYWVEGKASFALGARYRELVRRPFQPIYVEFTAETLAYNGRMSMEGHTGYIRVDSVLEARTIIPRTCKLPEVEPD